MSLSTADLAHTLSEMDVPDLASLPVEWRTLLRDPADRRYFQLVTASTVLEHGAAVEAVIEVACNHWRRKNAAYVAFLRPSTKKPDGGTPGNEGRSPSYREANHGWNVLHEALAAALGVLYPHPSQPKAFLAAKGLVVKRVGKLCTGWFPDNNDALTHHPQDTCPVHGGGE